MAGPGQRPPEPLARVLLLRRVHRRGRLRGTAWGRAASRLCADPLYARRSGPEWANVFGASFGTVGFGGSFCVEVHDLVHEVRVFFMIWGRGGGVL